MTRRTSDRLLVVAGIVALLVLAALAVLVTITHNQAIRDAQRRFHDQATVSAAVTQAVFGVSMQSTQEQANAALGGRRVDRQALERIVDQGQLVYAEVLDDSGRLLAASRGAPTERALARPFYVEQAIAGTPAFSNAYGSPGSTDQVVEWAVPFSVNPGRRVEILALRVSALSSFVSSFLSRLPPLKQGEAALLDRNGTILGSPTPGLEPGEHDPDTALLHALRSAPEGDYSVGGRDRRYVSAPLAGSPWRVVLAADTDALYADVNGARLVVPWVVFAILAIVVAGGLFLLRRATRASAEIARREASRRYALEINDNVIQRLTVAKLALETGQEDVSHRRIAETLREAQRLVNELMGDRGIESGDLRRRERVTSS